MTARSTTSSAEAAALDAYVKLMRAAESVTARAHTVLPEGVTITQFAALEALLHRGPLFQSELALKLLKSGGNLTLVVDNLERDGLVARERDAQDRRRIAVALTPKGRKFITGLFPKVAASLAREFSALTAADQATLAQLCKQLGRGVPVPSAAGPAASPAA
ncbi:MAG: MarR family transcriptional regulator [Verrucomicrobia bacterium]|nr:MarR family transcriptional regulator [Verrucomicrobiota bacterium]